MNVKLHWMDMITEMEIRSLMEIVNQHDRRKQISGVMFQVNIVGSKIICPFKVVDGIKMNVGNYCKFLDKIFFHWKRSLKLKHIFIKDNSLLHSEKLTIIHLAKKDSNPIENMESIIKDRCI